MLRKMMLIAAVVLATGCAEMNRHHTAKSNASCACCEECSCCKDGMCPMTKEKKAALAKGKDVKTSCCCKKSK